MFCLYLRITVITPELILFFIPNFQILKNACLGICLGQLQKVIKPDQNNDDYTVVM